MPSIGSTKITSELIINGKGIILYNQEILAVDVDPQIVLSIEVPANKTWRINYAELMCRGYSKWQVKVNDVLIAGGSTNPIKDKDRSDLVDNLDAASGETVDVLCWYSYGPNDMPVDTYIGVIEF